jgi:two-component system sensor histidine kinase PilS (NtrC family)
MTSRELRIPTVAAAFGSSGCNVATNNLRSDPGRSLLAVIAVRATVLFLGLNLAQPMGLLPERIAGIPFLPFCNILTVTLTLAHVALWWTARRQRIQLCIQMASDIALVAFLVSATGGVESAFVSFYLLIIMYGSVAGGRNWGKTASALSTLSYAAVIAGAQTGWIPQEFDLGTRTIIYRVALQVLGFFSVAFLGTHLSQRLYAVQEQLDEKIHSLQQLRSLNEHIVRSIRSGLITTDLTGEVTVVNNAAEELTGTRNAQALHRHVQTLFGGDLWRQIAHSDLFQSPRPLRHEQWVESASGGKRYLGFSISPLLDHNRELLGYIISFQDLTEIKRLEREVQRKERLATIGNMAAGIAHEIRNPLTSMTGSVEVLRSRANLPPADDRLLSILVRESDRLNRFLEDFLRFARPGENRHSPTDLCSLLQDSVTLLQNNPEFRTKYRLDLQTTSERLPVSGNADQLKQVFWNLAQNAVRAMPDGGNLSIHAGSAEKSAEVAFTDEGVGMTREEREQLFQPFQSRFAGGIGLGLSIIYQIIEEHQGEIAIESEKGRGTTVTLRLPLIE